MLSAVNLTSMDGSETEGFWNVDLAALVKTLEKNLFKTWDSSSSFKLIELKLKSGHD